MVRYSIPALLKGKADRMSRHSPKLSRSKNPLRDAVRAHDMLSSCFLACVTLPPNLPHTLLPSDSEFSKTRPSLRRYWLTIPFQLRYTWPRCVDLSSLTDRRLIHWPLLVLAASHLTAGGPEESLEEVPEKEEKNLSVGCVGHFDLQRRDSVKDVSEIGRSQHVNT
jgi:hypothetical protein